MSLLGVGAAQIDLVLPKISYKRGEHINGHFLIKGGTIEQLIKRIECDLVKVDQLTNAETIVDSSTILTSTKIETEQLNKVEFKFRIPENLEPSSKYFSYRFKTNLNFDKGADSKDSDMIQIIE